MCRSIQSTSLTVRLLSTGLLIALASRLQLLQTAIMQQGEDLAEAKDELAKTKAELEVAQDAWRQLTEVQGVPTEVCMPSTGADHAKCREAVDMLFTQVNAEDSQVVPALGTVSLPRVLDGE